MPNLIKDEEVVLHSQGGYVSNLWSAWRLGHLYLTNKRIFFLQPIGVIFETPFENIIEIKSACRKYAFRKKEALFLVCKHGKTGRILNTWIITADLETWKKKIYERLKIDMLTGKKVGFSRWIPGQRPGQRIDVAKRDTILEVFDEGDSINIIMELSGVREEDIQVDVDKGRVIISASGTVKDYYEEVFLDSDIDTESISIRYKNGIFQASLNKSGLETRQI